MSRRRKQEEEHVNHERWAISYLDMVTVMMCLFIVLYAISSVDQVKYEKLAGSLSEGFGTASAEVSVLDGGVGLQETTGTKPDGVESPEDPFSVLKEQGISAGELEAARAEVADLREVENRIRQQLVGSESENDVTFTLDERGLVIGLVSTDVFFEAESSRLTGRADAAIDAIAPALGEVGNQIAVEGHANTLPTTRYASNWELSSERATTVLRAVVGTGGLEPGRLRAIGMGDAHPVVEDAADPLAADPLVANRRVDIVVMSGAPENVRELIPQIAEITAPAA